jgi:hypothetical protein
VERGAELAGSLGCKRSDYDVSQLSTVGPQLSALASQLLAFSRTTRRN